MNYQPTPLRHRVYWAMGGLLMLVCVAWLVAAFRDLTGDVTGMGALDIPPLPEVRASASSLTVPDSMLGSSGALRFRTLTPAEAIAVPGFIDVLGEAAIRAPA